MYRRFARVEAHGKSPLYEALCEGVASDPDMLSFLQRQRADKRQPNLLLAAIRFLFGTQPDYEAFRTAVLDHQCEVEAVLRSHRTQTNEPGRCAPLLPLLASLPEPLALLEVGSAAGLCLLLDRYGYDYGGRRVGSREVVFECSPHGPVPVPDRLPEVAWRAGIDLEPVDVGDDSALRWLEALVWPEERDRLARLREAIELARRDPPRVVQGDLVELLARVADEAPPAATLVVFHTAVLTYLSSQEQEAFRAQVAALRAEWVSSEGPGVVAGLALPTTKPVGRSHFAVALNGRGVALCDPHGRWVQWLA